MIAVSRTKNAQSLTKTGGYFLWGKAFTKLVVLDYLFNFGHLFFFYFFNIGTHNAYTRKVAWYGASGINNVTNPFTPTNWDRSVVVSPTDDEMLVTVLQVVLL